MKTKQEIRDWLLENAVGFSGNLDLSDLDFSDFDGNVYINNMKVKKDLHQDHQIVTGDLYQHSQQVEGFLKQNHQTVNSYLMQNFQKVSGEFYDHKLDEDEYWDESKFYVVRRKKLKEITLKELEKMGFKLKEEN